MLSRVRRLVGGSVDEWVRRAVGTATGAAALVITLGWDARLFARFSIVRSAGAEEVVLRRFFADRTAAERALVPDAPTPTRRAGPPPIPTPDEGPLPSFDGATGWLNTPGGAALSPEALRGKVVVVNVWTYECYNCLNALPHVKALAAKDRGQDVVVVGVHTPEFARERVPANVAAATRRLGVAYPVALDNGFATDEDRVVAQLLAERAPARPR